MASEEAGLPRAGTNPVTSSARAETTRGAGHKDRPQQQRAVGPEMRAAAPGAVQDEMRSPVRRQTGLRLGWVQRLAHVHLDRTTPPPLRMQPHPFAARAWLVTGRMGGRRGGRSDRWVRVRARRVPVERNVTR
ncbi:hypothetical protein GCM10010095_62950 [Streptomyces anthocyanicus]|nr:hypothetical protein GCM10010095_62950 [Streptomyces anthocyanicus]